MPRCFPTGAPFYEWKSPRYGWAELFRKRGNAEKWAENRDSPKIFTAARHTHHTQEPWNLSTTRAHKTSVHPNDAYHTITPQRHTMRPLYMHLWMGYGWGGAMEAGFPLIQDGVRARCWREWRKFYFWDTSSLTNLAVQIGFRYWGGDSSGGTHKFERLDDPFQQNTQITH